VTNSVWQILFRFTPITYPYFLRGFSLKTQFGEKKNDLKIVLYLLSIDWKLWGKFSNLENTNCMGQNFCGIYFELLSSAKLKIHNYIKILTLACNVYLDLWKKYLSLAWQVCPFRIIVTKSKMLRGHYLQILGQYLYLYNLAQVTCQSCIDCALYVRHCK